jgi:poly(A) polymerase Pap1
MSTFHAINITDIQALNGNLINEFKNQILFINEQERQKVIALMAKIQKEYVC